MVCDPVVTRQLIRLAVEQRIPTLRREAPEIPSSVQIYVLFSKLRSALVIFEMKEYGSTFSAAPVPITFSIHEVCELISGKVAKSVRDGTDFYALGRGARLSPMDALVWIAVNGLVVFVIFKAVQNFSKGRKEGKGES